MPISAKYSTIYLSLLSKYNQLPWYKKLGFWLTAPKMAWGLFGYKQNPRRDEIIQIVESAKLSWIYKTWFERTIYEALPSPNTQSNFNKRTAAPDVVALGECRDIIHVIAGLPYPDSKLEHVRGFIDPVTRQALGATSKTLRNFVFGTDEERTAKMTRTLLKAVAYGMESKAANIHSKQDRNITLKPSDTNGLFKFDLFAEDLLEASPLLLLERGDVTDWAGRTFKNITAFEYALWAKDFKMIQMMLGCILEKPEGAAIKTALNVQCEQVTAPVHTGGGVTYTLTYLRPNGKYEDFIWDDTSTRVIEVHTENHFDLTPLIEAYEVIQHRRILLKDVDAFWVKIIGMLQHLLPVHILQRYCGQNTLSGPMPKFKDEVFERSAFFLNCITRKGDTLFTSFLGEDFALSRFDGGVLGLRYVDCHVRQQIVYNLAAIRQLDKVSTSEVEAIKQQLSQPQLTGVLRP